MGRAQCLVTRGDRILMVKHRVDGQEYWCLPGGGIDAAETPEQAALRELVEECGIIGRLAREISVYVDPSPSDYRAYTYLVDVGEQEPVLGMDPELGDHQILVDVEWLALREIPERDRAFLWSAGLLAVPGFFKEIEAWGDEISYPGVSQSDSSDASIPK